MYVRQMILPLLRTYSSDSGIEALVSCCVGLCSHNTSIALVKPCTTLQSLVSSFLSGGPVCARATIIYKQFNNHLKTIMHQSVKLTYAIWLLQLVISSSLILALGDPSQAPPGFEPRSPAGEADDFPTELSTIFFFYVVTVFSVFLYSIFQFFPAVLRTLINSFMIFTGQILLKNSPLAKLFFCGILFRKSKNSSIGLILR